MPTHRRPAWNDAVLPGPDLARVTRTFRAVQSLVRDSLAAVRMLVTAFTNLLVPDLAAHLVPSIQLPALIGEGALRAWLLIVGVDEERWNAARSGAAMADVPRDRPNR